MPQTEPESPILRSRRERYLAWLLFLIALGLAALLWWPGTGMTNDPAPAPAPMGQDE